MRPCCENVSNVLNGRRGRLLPGELCGSLVTPYLISIYANYHNAFPLSASERASDREKSDEPRRSVSGSDRIGARCRMKSHQIRSRVYQGDYGNLQRDRNDGLERAFASGSIRDYNPRGLCVREWPLRPRMHAPLAALSCVRARCDASLPADRFKSPPSLPAMASLIPHLSGPHGSIARDIVIGQLLYFR